MSEENKSLVQIIEANGIMLTEAESIVSCFGVHMSEAKKLVEEGELITVADENDKEGMDKARSVRLALGRIRVQSEKDRKSFKEDYLKKGRAIDDIAKMVSSLTTPLEDKLEGLEKTALRIAVEKKDKAIKERFEQRVERLRPYLAPNSDMSSVFGLKDMPDEAFENLLVREKEAHELRMKKAEEERVAVEAAEKAKRDEDARIRTENETLKAEAEERERKEKIEREAREEEDRKRKEAEDERLRVEREAREKAESELRERERIEAEKKAEEERQRIEKERLEKEEREAAEAESLRKAQLPDKEKLGDYVNALCAVPMPSLSTTEMQKAMITFQEEFAKIIKIISE